MATVNEKMTALANEVRELSGTTTEKGIVDMTLDVNAANTEIIEQTELIAQIITALEGKANNGDSNEDVTAEVNIYTAKIAELEATIAELEKALGIESDIERLEGDGQEFYTMAPSTLSFRSTAPLNELQDVTINGETVDPSNYELEEGSTIVKLKHDYLSTLDIGKYELAVVSNSKTAKGDFTVAAPELNEYGFYYNQPYRVTEPIESAEVLDLLLVFLSNEVISLFNLENGTHEFVDYVYSNNQIQFSYSASPISISFELAVVATDVMSGKAYDSARTTSVTFALSDTIVSDSYYIYLCHNSSYLWNQHITEEYPLVKDNIFGEAITTVASGAYANCINIVHVILPDTIQHISDEAFYNCGNLERITIPKSLTYIEDAAFSNCFNLTDIMFKGTMVQWNAVEKFPSWNDGVPATYVQCSDGQVAL